MLLVPGDDLASDISEPNQPSLPPFLGQTCPITARLLVTHCDARRERHAGCDGQAGRDTCNPANRQSPLSLLPHAGAQASEMVEVRAPPALGGEWPGKVPGQTCA